MDGSQEEVASKLQVPLVPLHIVHDEEDGGSPQGQLPSPHPPLQLSAKAQGMRATFFRQKNPYASSQERLTTRRTLRVRRGLLPQPAAPLFPSLIMARMRRPWRSTCRTSITPRSSAETGRVLI